MTKYCAFCGTPFETHNNRLVYCPGKDCAVTAKRKKNRERMRQVYAERAREKQSDPFVVDDKTREYLRKKGELLIKTPRMEARS